MTISKDQRDSVAEDIVDSGLCSLSMKEIWYPNQ